MRRLGLYPGRLPGFDKRGFDRRELIECVLAADACGYDSFWMPEVWERDATKAVSDDMVDAIAICGPIETCRARLDEMYAVGAGLPIVAIPTEGAVASRCRIIESLVV